MVIARKGAVADVAATPVKVGVMPLFSTWVYLCQDGPRHLNEALERLARQLMKHERNTARRTSVGGWHYTGDVFALDEPVLLALLGHLEQHVQAFINHFRSNSTKKLDRFRLQGWISVSRAGHHDVLHCHPGSFISGVYYVRVPEPIRGGEFVFRDPRGPAVAMYETPGIELPWVADGAGVPFTPATGQLLLFPAWLEHRVEPFEGEGERISIAFNASNP